MIFPTISDAVRLSRLEPPSSRVQLVLDTDTYNEIDDQFAIVYALLAGERLDLQAIAAPFHNKRSSGPSDGMEKSFEEILRVLNKMGRSGESFVFKGASRFFDRSLEPPISDASQDLIERAMSRSADDAPLYVACIGAFTNLAAAFIAEPRIVERIVVVLQGGHALNWKDTHEFNLAQDLHAARIVLNCGVPIVQIPALGVTTHLLTTKAELATYLPGHNSIGDYLFEIFCDYTKDHFGSSKVIWDIASIAYLINPDCIPTHIVHSPIITDQYTWSFDDSRHLMRSVTFIHRDAVFRDFFTRLQSSMNPDSVK